MIIAQFGILQYLGYVSVSSASGLLMERDVVLSPYRTEAVEALTRGADSPVQTQWRSGAPYAIYIAEYGVYRSASPFQTSPLIAEIGAHSLEGAFSRFLTSEKSQ
jgi:hypothetical protein